MSRSLGSEAHFGRDQGVGGSTRPLCLSTRVRSIRPQCVGCKERLGFIRLPLAICALQHDDPDEAAVTTENLSKHFDREVHEAVARANPFPFGFVAHVVLTLQEQ